jgi:hypothetical protein
MADTEVTSTKPEIPPKIRDRIEALATFSGKDDSHWWVEKDLNNNEIRRVLKVDTTMATLLENQYQWLTNFRTWNKIDDEHPSEIASLDFLDIATQMFHAEHSPLRKIVGVQPMAAPVGLLYYMTYRCLETAKGDENDTGTRKIGLEVLSTLLEAGTRKMNTSASIEAVQDARVIPHIRDSLVEIIGKELRGEIETEIVEDLVKLAAENGPSAFTLDPDLQITGNDAAINQLVSMMEGSVIEPLNVGQQISVSNLQTFTAGEGNSIARATRRGVGNYLIVGPALFDFLYKNAPTNNSDGTLKLNFTISKERAETVAAGFETLIEVGTSGFRMLFVSNALEGNQYLVGYKGQNGDVDTGYFYNPYVPLMSGGVGIDPKTYQPVVAFLTRYGKHTISPQGDDLLATASNYFRTGHVLNLPGYEAPAEDKANQDEL